MKSAAKTNAVRLVFCVGLFVAIFGHKSLGLPEWTEDAGILVGFFSAILLLWMQIKERDAARPLRNPAAIRRGTCISVALIVVVTLSSPFWLPYTGITLGFPQLVVSASIGCIIGIAVLLLGCMVSPKGLTSAAANRSLALRVDVDRVLAPQHWLRVRLFVDARHLHQ